MKAKNAILTGLLLVVCFSLSGCVTVTTSGILAAVQQVVSPAARKVKGDRGESINVLGARVGDVGAGVWAGRIPPGDLTADERKRLESIEAWVNQVESERALERALERSEK